MTYLPAADLVSEPVLPRSEEPLFFSDTLAASPSPSSAASSAGKPLAAVCMVKWRLVPVEENRSELCQLPGCNQCPEDTRQDRSRRLEHNRLRIHTQTGSTAAHSNHSREKQHRHSPSIEQGVSWESFPQDSGRDRIIDSRIAERIRQRCRVQQEKLKKHLGGKSERYWSSQNDSTDRLSAEITQNTKRGQDEVF